MGLDGQPAALILAGGLGLGAYQAGAFAALDASGRFRFDAIAGSSIGAINGAVIAGGPPEDAAARLGAFWRALETEVAPSPPADVPGWSRGGTLRHLTNWANTLSTRLGGAPRLFEPRLVPSAPPPSLYDLAPARATISHFVDFDRLNNGAVRLVVATTDVETGATVLFDTAAGDRIEIDHLIASGALLPAFPPVRIGGRLLGDGGLSANAPLEPLLSSARAGPATRLCFLIDLFSGEGRAPSGLERAAERADDLIFANQTRLRLEAIVRERGLEARLGEAAPTDLLHLSLRASPDDAGPEKTYDFSRATLADRRAAGAADAAAALDLIGALPDEGAPGLRVHPVRAEPVRGGRAAAAR